MTKLSDQLKRATAFDDEYNRTKRIEWATKACYSAFVEPTKEQLAQVPTIGIVPWDVATQVENARLAPILEALGRLCDAADETVAMLSPDGPFEISPVKLEKALAEVREVLLEK